MITEKQALYISNLVDRNRDEYDTLQGVWNKMPEPDKVDQRQLIFAEKINGLSSEQASYIINAFTKDKGYRLSKAFKILIDINI